MLSPGIGFCGGVLTHSPWTLFLFPLIVTGLKSEGNYKKGSADTSNEMCPCLPMDKCPRIYGQSAMDIRELGFLEPCHRFGTVRCCGVTIRIEHEKDTDRDWDNVIGSRKKGEISTIRAENDLQLAETSTSHSPVTMKTVGGTERQSSATSGNRFKKLRRRKLVFGSKGRKVHDETKGTSGDLSTAGALTPASIETESPMKSASYTASLPTSDHIRTVSRPKFRPIHRKLKESMKQNLKSKSSESKTGMTESVTSRKRIMSSRENSNRHPVFSRVRKPFLRANSNPLGQAPAPEKIPLEETEKESPMESTDASNNSSTSPPLTTVLDVGTDSKRKPVQTPASMSIKEDLPKRGNLTSFRYRKRIPGRIRPILTNKKYLSQNTPKPLVTSTPAVLPALNSETNLEENSEKENSEKIENVTSSSPPLTIKFRGPTRMIGRRGPIKPKLETESPAVTAERGVFVKSDPVSSHAFPFHLQEGKRVSSPIYRNRVRMHRIKTTTAPPHSTEPELHKEEAQRNHFGEAPTQEPASTHLTGPPLTTSDEMKNLDTLLTLDPYQANRNLGKQKSDPVQKSYEPTDATDAPLSITQATPFHQGTKDDGGSSLISKPLPEYDTVPTFPTSALDHIHFDATESVSMRTSPLRYTYVDDSAPKRRPVEPYQSNYYENGNPVRDLTVRPSAPRRTQTETGSRNRGSTKGKTSYPAYTTNPLRAPPLKISASTRRFKVPTDFSSVFQKSKHILSTLDESKHEEDGEGPLNEENYDLVLDKEAREHLRGSVIQKQQFHSGHSYQDPISTGMHAPDNSNKFHPLNYSDSENEEMEEETRLHVEIVEKESPKPSSLSSSTQSVNKEGKQKYRRISLRKPGYDTRKLSYLSSNVNTDMRPRIINSQMVNTSRIKEKETPGHEFQDNLNPRRFSGKLPTVFVTPSPEPIKSKPENATRFRFPAFTGAINYGDVGVRTSHLRPEEPVRKAHSNPNSSGNDFHLTTTTTSPLPTRSIVYQVHTTTDTYHQVQPTDIPISSKVTPTMTPISVLSNSRPSSETKHGIGVEYKILMSRPSPTPTKQESPRFSVPTVFNFTKSGYEELIPEFMPQLPRNPGSSQTNNKNSFAVNGNQYYFHLSKAQSHQTSSSENSGIGKQESPKNKVKTVPRKEPSSSALKKPMLSHAEIQILPSGQSAQNSQHLYTKQAYIENSSPNPLSSSDLKKESLNVQNISSPTSQQIQALKENLDANHGGKPEIDTFRPVHSANAFSRPSKTHSMEFQPVLSDSEHGSPYLGHIPPREHAERFKVSSTFPPHASEKQKPNFSGIQVNEPFRSEYMSGGKNIISTYSPAHTQRPVESSSLFPINIYGEAQQAPGNSHPTPLPQNLHHTKYSPNQFNPYAQSGSPIRFPTETPHYIKEYHQHHAISNLILRQLQNSARSTRSANLTEEEIEWILESSKNSAGHDKLMKDVEVLSPLVDALYLEDDMKVDGEGKRALATETEDQKEESRERTLETRVVKRVHNQTESDLPDVKDVTETPLDAKERKNAKGKDEGGFRAPKMIQGGFTPLVTYSEKDPGPLVINLMVSPRMSREQERNLMTMAR